MSKYIDNHLLERIALALEKLAGIEKAKEEPVLELVKEEPIEEEKVSPEAEKEPLIKEEEEVKMPEEVKEQVVSLEEVLVAPVEEVKPVEEKPLPAKRASKRDEIRKPRINPYRLKEEPKRAPVSGFRIKEK